MHPVRMAMLKLLVDTPQYTTTALKKELGVNWNDFNNHLKSLEKKGYIHLELNFVEENVGQLVTIEPSAIPQFEALREVLTQFLDNTPKIDEYLDHVSMLTGNDRT